MEKRTSSHPFKRVANILAGLAILSSAWVVTSTAWATELAPTTVPAQMVLKTTVNPPVQLAYWHRYHRHGWYHGRWHRYNHGWYRHWYRY